ncbi:ADP-ribosylglycohydrolase family protein [Corallococcus exercitus]|uniref:ADP-ribosylglycohydrolase family protein n=1 Tax=Corallococcus exercitus TaxID=2316736 RepID=UPI0035D43965
MSDIPCKPLDVPARLARALVSLDGVSVGDAFGERFFGPHERVQPWVEQRMLPRAPWTYTDDTEMTLSLVQVWATERTCAWWCAARHLDSFEEALWCTVAGFGDRDTTCAIVGGIVALSAGRSSIPAPWLSAREPLRRRV